MPKVSGEDYTLISRGERADDEVLPLRNPGGETLLQVFPKHVLTISSISSYKISKTSEWQHSKNTHPKYKNLAHSGGHH